MSNFTFLTEEQCFGSDRLDILEKRGTINLGEQQEKMKE